MLALEWYALLEEKVVDTSNKDLFLADNEFQNYYCATEWCLKVFLHM